MTGYSIKRLLPMLVISTKLKPGQIVSLREVREENSIAPVTIKKLAEHRDAKTATSARCLLGITKHLWVLKAGYLAASFQENYEVLSSAAIQGKSDHILKIT